jgi:small subunit ribosomal protein S14
MAKKSVESRNHKREKMVAATSEYTKQLRIKSKLDSEEGDAARLTLNKRVRNKSDVRVRNRCASCGRPRGVVSKFGLCRICLRLSVMRGYIPGMRKASW